MASNNNQPLSPQGYNIKDLPVNVNPFWGDDDNPDPTIYQRLTALEGDVSELEETSATKAELNDYYDKDEIDAKFNNLPDIDPSDYVTNTELSGIIAQEHNDVLDDVSESYYNKTQTDNLLSTKANISSFNNYYNKTEIDTKQADDDSRLDALEANDTIQDGAIAGLGTDLGNLSGTVDDLSDDMTTAKGDITDIKGDITDIKGDVTDIEGDIVNIQLDISLLQGSVLGLDNRVSALEAIIGDINSVLEVVLNGNNS